MDGCRLKGAAGQPRSRAVAARASNIEFWVGASHPKYHALKAVKQAIYAPCDLRLIELG